MTPQWQPGKLVTLRGREWVVLPSDDPENLLIVKPLGGSDDETTGIYLPLEIPSDRPVDARFEPPTAADLGDIATARLLYDSARLAFRNGAGPFRALAKLSFRPRAYQIVPLIMALRQSSHSPVRLLIADDVGVGKTIEALLIIRELLERRTIKRFAVICLPHLCEQWQEEIRSKLDIEAVIIRSNTQAGLDRRIQGDASVYDYYPFQIISVDFIKSDTRRDVFVQQCPELVIVDETHTCARPAGASAAQQQRYHLISRIAAKPNQHLVMLTATPHSGKPEEFQSLLGLLRPEFESLDLPAASQNQRRDLARHFIQRKRADVEKWMDETTKFATRDAFEWYYDLSRDYLHFFQDILTFARTLVVPDFTGKRKKRVQYWTALALLRGVMSSPAAGVKMLNARLEGLAESAPDSDTISAAESSAENPVRDLDFGFEGDNAPTQVLEQTGWSEHQRAQLKTFAARLQTLANIQSDGKLYAASIVLEDWLDKGVNPVVFCRYIETARYLGEHLGPALRKKHPKADIQVVTSEDPDDVRRDRIEKMSGDKPRVLIATDCLSEGINLQELFTGVFHYDLPWNPNRLEQREGRVDRFGQQADEVKACLLYGADNPIDGIVLDVLLRKVREIKRTTGINVPFPEDSQSIIDTITQALLLNPDRRIEKKRGSKGPGQDQLMLFDFTSFGEAAAAKDRVTRKIDEAADREKESRSIFAHHAIKAHEIEHDLRAVDEAIGDPRAVQDFVTTALANLLGVQVTTEHKGYGIVPGNLPQQLIDLLRWPGHPPPKSTGTKLIKVSFESPTPEGYHYLGRNHRFVEQLCQFVMANTLARQDKRAARTAVIRTRQVERKTTLLLFRCRNVIEQQKGGHRIVAEEMLLWGWRGVPNDRQFIAHTEAKALLAAARASSDLSPQARAAFLENELRLMDSLAPEFQTLAEKQSKELVDAHERFSALMDKQRFQVVYPVLPMDLLGIYILLPEAAA
jgi:superfamily II DNA or RNA helicase